VSDISKVLWTEGMLLKPQHLQQNDRYFSHRMLKNISAFQPYYWGVSSLELDNSLLNLGKFSLSKCSGFFQDGTYFDIPSQDHSPEPITIPSGLSNVLIYLAIPLYRPGCSEVTALSEEEKYFRYRSTWHEIVDSTDPESHVTKIQIGKISLQLKLESEDLSGYACIPIAKIRESKANNEIILEEGFLPSTINAFCIPNLKRYHDEIHALLKNRKDILSKQIVEPSYSASADVTDFLLLRTINRFEVFFKYYSQRSVLHPEDFYKVLLELLAEISVFNPKTRNLVENVPIYDHQDLDSSFQYLIASLRSTLGKVNQYSATPLSIEKLETGIYNCLLPDLESLDATKIILALNANIPSEELIKRIPRQIKIGSIGEVERIVQHALPGLPILYLPTAPRQIPFHSGFVYFELDRNDVNWKKLEEMNSFAMHIAGNYPGLQVEAWRVREHENTQ